MTENVYSILWSDYEHGTITYDDGKILELDGIDRESYDENIRYDIQEMPYYGEYSIFIFKSYSYS